MSAGRLFIAIVLMAPALAQAQATRTWISGVGDDANPCSRTAPCRTSQGAVSKTAAGGEIDSMDPGVFGAVTLTKSMTIDGRGGRNTTLSATSGADAVVISAGPTGVVTLRNLNIDGAGTGGRGVRITSARVVQIEDCVISGFTAEGIKVEAAGARLVLSNVVVRNNGGTGVLLNAPSASAQVRTSSFTANGDGFRAAAGGFATIYDSVLSGNTGAGLVSDASDVNLERATLSGNGTGILATGADSVVRISKASIVESTSAALQETAGGQVRSFGSNRIPGLATTVAPARASTVTQLTAELQADRSVRLSVRVESPVDAPSGTVTFSEGAVQVGVGTLAGQDAALVLTGLAPGTHAFTAAYQGDELFEPSTSEVAELTLESSSDGGTNPGDGGTEDPSPDGPATGCGCTGGAGAPGLALALAALALRTRSAARA